MRLINANPLGAIELHILDHGSLTLEAGEVFEVPDEVGAELLTQVGNYLPAPEPAPEVEPAPEPAPRVPRQRA